MKLFILILLSALLASISTSSSIRLAGGSTREGGSSGTRANGNRSLSNA